MRKTRNALMDDAGQRWEFLYTEEIYYEAAEGEPHMRQRIIDFAYRREGDSEWLRLPPWADVAEDWKVNLCFFDEDDDGDICRFWTVSSVAAEAAVREGTA